MDKPKRRRKKPNKEKRQAVKAAHADTYNRGFIHGYGMGQDDGYKKGYEQGFLAACRGFDK